MSLMRQRGRIATWSALLTCSTNNGIYTATIVVGKVDGNPLFFPVDDDLFTPLTERHFATIPPYYDASATWPHDKDASGNNRLHNFSFTSEVRYWFLYDKSKTYTLDFVGDDDRFQNSHAAGGCRCGAISRYRDPQGHC